VPKFFKALPLLMWIGIITILSLVRFSSVPNIDVPNIDKYVHVFFYFVLTLCLYYYFNNAMNGLKRKIFFACFMAIIYGIVIEVLQGVLTNYRQPDFFDVLANALGSLLAGLMILLYEKMLNLNKQ
jgi:VanZ family protein